MIQTMALTRFYRLSRERRLMVVRAAVAVTAASVAVALLPFRKAVELGSVALKPRNGITPEDSVWAVEAVARRMPWQPMCIQKGLAVQRLLRSGGIDAILHYGARRSPESGELEAHVWVSVSGETIIGGEDAAGFAELAQFP
jgi:hypothetical protein